MTAMEEGPRWPPISIRIAAWVAAAISIVVVIGMKVAHLAATGRAWIPAIFAAWAAAAAAFAVGHRALSRRLRR